MSDAWPHSTNYTIGTLANWAAFLLGVWLLAWGGGEGRLGQPLLWALAVLLALSVLLQFLAAYRLIARQDEYIRAVTAKRIIAATGLTLTAAVLAGLGEQFLGAPDVPMWVLYPLFWGLFGIVTPFIGASRP